MTPRSRADGPGLPELDGWEATRRINADPATRGIPVIVLSADETSEAKEKAFAAGCQEFETKPVNWEVLFKKIETELAKASAGDSVNLAVPPADGPATEIRRRPAPEASQDLASRERERPEQRPPVAHAPGSPNPATSDSATVPVQAKHVLVVEDNDANREMLCRRLNKQGFATTEAANGREALARVLDRRFDLVLLDIMMPEVDGYTVLAELKADPELEAIPVIMISAVDEMASVVRCIEMGAEDYLAKPYDPVLLQARINACLDKRRLRDQEMEYLRAVADLTQAAALVERGEFDPDVLARVAARTDALGTLARVFEKMAREVRAREQKLNQEVARLQVEIDRAKMTDQVKGITGTAYFEALEKKAAGLRSGRSGRLRIAPKPPEE